MSVAATASAAERASRTPMLSPAAFSRAPSAAGNRMSQATMRSMPPSRSPRRSPSGLAETDEGNAWGVAAGHGVSILNRFHFRVLPRRLEAHRHQPFAAALYEDAGDARRLAVERLVLANHHDGVVKAEQPRRHQRRRSGIGAAALLLGQHRLAVGLRSAAAPRRPPGIRRRRAAPGFRARDASPRSPAAAKRQGNRARRIARLIGQCVAGIVPFLAAGAWGIVGKFCETSW